MIDIKKYLKFVFMFSVFVMCFLFNTNNVFASESTENEDDSNLDDGELQYWSAVAASLFHAPIQNNFWYSAGTTYSFSGANVMVAYKTYALDKYNVFNLGNQIYDDYNDSVGAYPIQADSYYFDKNGDLFTHTGPLTLGTSKHFANVIFSEDYIWSHEAKNYTYSYQSSLMDEAFLEEHNLTNMFVFDTWDSTGRFNPYVNCRELDDNTIYIKISVDDSTFDIPADVSGIYVDYLFSNQTYEYFSWWRCYINGVHGLYTLDDLEKRLPHYRDTWDALNIIGIGTYTVDESVHSGFIQAPNLEGYNVVSWNYISLKLDKYATRDAFVNSNFKDNFKGYTEVTASTPGDEIFEPDDYYPPSGGGFNMEDYIQNTDFGFNYISNYITSISTNILVFNSMIAIVLAWIPEPILNLLFAALMTFVSILFIKLILHLL